MQYYTCCTQDFYVSSRLPKQNFISKEPFEGLFTIMVCHETYKDNKNNWLSPDEVFSDDGKNLHVKK